MIEREIKGYIESEAPSIHWGFLPTRGQVVLDLGCGINNQEYIPTPLHWIQGEATKVYGVDPSPQSYEWFKQNLNLKNFIPFMDWVDRTEKFEIYFNVCKPSVVKIDVEGAEIFMNAVKPEFLEGIRHIGIEYHSLACLLSCESLLEKNGYTLEYYKFPHLDIDHQGVLYAYKKNIITNKK